MQLPLVNLKVVRFADLIALRPEAILYLQQLSVYPRAVFATSGE